MELPYDYSLSHHQLLFIAFIIICATNMEIVFTKSKQNDIFTKHKANVSDYGYPKTKNKP
ncbi:MAG: hypothetical protein JWQ54_1166 [Mucilaginibacter sp.]|nr:hypothetical protein [Mucilaginibacter sp.]